MRPFYATFASSLTSLLLSLLLLLLLYIPARNTTRMLVVYVGARILICEFIVYATGLHSLITHGNNESDAREGQKESPAIRPWAFKLLTRHVIYFPRSFPSYKGCIMFCMYFFISISLFLAISLFCQGKKKVDRNIYPKGCCVSPNEGLAKFSALGFFKNCIAQQGGKLYSTVFDVKNFFQKLDRRYWQPKGA